MQVGQACLQRYVNRLLRTVPRQAKVLPKQRGPLALQMDELW
ncbi:MAG: hypothetical protein ACKO7W_11230 [Elainella sp.]